MAVRLPPLSFYPSSCDDDIDPYAGVVDAQLKVYDTMNVRVVDASIMPMQISAHLSATLYGVAEKAADLIKASH